MIVDAPLVTAVAFLITAIGSLLASVLGGYAAIKAASAARSSDDTRTMVTKLEINTNSMKDELVREVREAAIARGTLIGREEAATELSSLGENAQGHQG